MYQTGYPTTQTKVLQSIVRQLQTIPQLAGDRLVYLSLDPNEEPEQRQNVVATVAPIGGSFDEGHFIGTAQAKEVSGVLITIWSQVRLDPAGSDEAMLTDTNRGLLILKQLVLQALTNFMPTDEDNNILVVNPMRPTQSGHPQRTPDAVGVVSLSFSTEFVWSL